MSDEISNDLGQNLSGLQSYPNFAQNNESESLAERSKRISKKVDFSVIRDLNILLGLITKRKMFTSSTLSYKSCILYQYFGIGLISYDHLAKE